MRTINIPPGALRVTRFKKYDDHKDVWEDYISSCGGDTGTGEYYITTHGIEEYTSVDLTIKAIRSVKTNLRVYPGDYIFDMPDGKFIVVRKPKKST